ncbi:unnamed protein product [Brassica rapa subsp. trilocularis]
MGGGEPMDHHQQRISATKSDGVGQGNLYSPDHAIKVATKLDENVGQGDLYSPDHAIKIATSPEHKLNSESEEEKQRMLGLKSLATVKDKVLEKLAAAAVPSESLENAKQFLEGVIKDFAGAAHGMTKDALHRIKTHLAVILPSVSPSVTGKKIVDDAEKEEEDERKSEASSNDGSAGKLPFSKL